MIVKNAIRFCLYFLHTLPELVSACIGLGAEDIAHVQLLASPAKIPPRSVSWKKIALTDVRIFNGNSIQPPSTVIIDGPRIGLNSNVTVDETIDCQGNVLIPGLIDSHAHPTNITNLEQLVSYGVTTVMSMSCAPESACGTLRGQTGLADFYTAGLLATSPNGSHAKLPSSLGQLINSPLDAAEFIANRVGNGSDYIKLVAEPNGMTQQEHDALVSTAHASGMQVMTHTTQFAAYQQAVASGADNIQHIPADLPLTSQIAQTMAKSNQIGTPTLTVIQAFINTPRVPSWRYQYAQEGVQVLQKAGVPILAGTDANAGNASAQIPSVPFGSSLHGELQMLHDAGMQTLDVLNAATKRPANAFGLWDRGVIKPGYRADLVLIRGDPIANISNTRNIERVWAGGIEYRS